MSWVRVADLDELVPGTARRFDIGEHRVAVFRVEDDVYAIGDRCSHAEASLSEGELDDLEVECPLHGALFVLDEPSVGLHHRDIGQLITTLKALRDRGNSVVVVEHDMDFVRALNSRVTVLHQGTVLAEGSMDQVQNDPRVVEVYLGESAQRG